MDEHGTPEPDEPDTPEPDEPDTPVSDPREARARHHAATGESAGTAYLRALSDEERRWMTAMVAGVAREHGVDADDVLQDLQLSLLRCTSIDTGRSGVRGWLRQRARWRALDLRRREGTPPDELDEQDAGPAPPPTGPDHEWTTERLQALELNKNEAQAVLLLLWGLDIPLRDFAQLVGRSAVQARQDRSRGLGRIRKLFDLSAEEHQALTASRQHVSIAAAAADLGLAEADLRRLVRSAEERIERTLGRTPPRTRRDEDDPHAR